MQPITESIITEHVKVLLQRNLCSGKCRRTENQLMTSTFETIYTISEFYLEQSLVLPDFIVMKQERIEGVD